MRLINTSTYQFEEFPDERNVEYAILSHRWEEEEVLFQDWDWTPQKGLVKPKRMKGFYKILMCCKQARDTGIQYAWVDTCCIDKKSSAELQEAINSMFRWYKSAKICYAYLSDVSSGPNAASELGSSKWFTRGWTLQELLAPKDLVFFSHAWAEIQSRAFFAATISDLTRVPWAILWSGFNGLGESGILVAQVMNWARDRETTRIEDRAYSLLGLLDVFMPMLYGEGERAFRRLQEELIRKSGDQSILAWTGMPFSSYGGGLARSPGYFQRIFQSDQGENIQRRRPALVTSEGIEVEVNFLPWAPGIHLAMFNFRLKDPATDRPLRCGIFLAAIDKGNRFARVTYHDEELKTVPWKDKLFISNETRRITIVHDLREDEAQRVLRDYLTDTTMFNIEVDLGLKGRGHPLLWIYSEAHQPPNALTKREQVSMANGDWGLMCQIDFPDSIGRLNTIALAINEDFDIILLLSSRYGKERWTSQNGPEMSLALSQHDPWIAAPKRLGERPLHFAKISRDFSIATVNTRNYDGEVSSSFWTKILSEREIALKIDQIGQEWTCSLVIDAHSHWVGDASTVGEGRNLPSGAVMVRVDVGYPTTIQLSRKVTLRHGGHIEWASLE
jgi:hypothetical protein